MLAVVSTNMWSTFRFSHLNRHLLDMFNSTFIVLIYISCSIWYFNVCWCYSAPDFSSVFRWSFLPHYGTSSTHVFLRLVWKESQLEFLKWVFHLVNNQIHTDGMKTFGRREVQQLFCVIIIFFKSDFNKLLFFFIFAQKTVIWFFIGLIWLFCVFLCVTVLYLQMRKRWRKMF